MTKKYYLALATVWIAGCATTQTMPENLYQQYGGFAAWTQRCFENSYLTPQTYADTKNALVYLLSTWNYDAAKMESMMRGAYAGASPSAASCRQTEANAYQLISAANQHRADKKENQKSFNEALQEFNRSMSTNKPVYCNRRAAC